eukprot:TRINITY_DN6130_c0_g1_i1.p1 TRINITY_DN6130_c0_g1~~TRINITY_DN6130_c0_g1_i1.p1  ORF type:complete len:1031 (-),score=96.68 TRINITY_DN6130_c0_g1_i1:82-3174(-)
MIRFIWALTLVRCARVKQQEQDSHTGNRSSDALQRIENLLEDTSALSNALDKALNYVSLERNALCPERDEAAKEKLSQTLRDSVKCCTYAFKESFESSGETCITLHFHVGSTLMQVRYIDGGPLEYIKPPPCSGGDEEQGEDFEGHATRIPLDSDIVLAAKSAMEMRLRDMCPQARSEHVQIAKVHAASSQVVEGLKISMIVELASGALHRSVIEFGSGGEVIDWLRPSAFDDTDPCLILMHSTLPRAVLKELEALDREHSTDGEASPSGHLRVLDDVASPASLLQLSRLSMQQPVNDYDVRTDTRAPQYQKCFPTPDAAVSAQGSCGSCWAFAALGALSDRHCLAEPRSMLTPNGGRRTLSVQQVLSCHHRDGCEGGHGNILYKSLLQGMKLTYTDKYPYESRCFVDSDGFTDDDLVKDVDCRAYKRMPDTDVRKPCKCIDLFKRPTRQSSCKAHVDSVGKFTIAGFFRIPKAGSMASIWSKVGLSQDDVVRAIQNAIYEAGPVYTAIDVFEDFHSIDPDTIYRHRKNSGKQVGVHAVVIVGWGSISEAAKTTSYWTLRNSWGADWCDRGHYKHVRGINDCNIEAAVVVPTLEDEILGQRLEFIKTSISVQSNGRKNARSPSNGTRASTWELEIQCSGACQPQVATILDLKGPVELPQSGSKCCCDEQMYSPPRCRRLSWFYLKSDNILGSMERVCGAFDMGRGTVSTVEAASPDACEDQVHGDVFGGGLSLPMTRVASDKIKIEVDLDDASLHGKHDLFVAASSADGHSNVAERVYAINVAGSRGASTVQPIFQFLSTWQQIVRETTEHQVVSAWGKRWEVREYYVLKVAAQCSEECRGEAILLGLESSFHPRGSDALRLDLVPTKDPRTLTWTVKVDDLPPGEFGVDITAHARRADSSTSITRSNAVEIPRLSPTQGVAWLPVSITKISYQVKGRDNNRIQELIASCSKPCSIVDFRVEGSPISLSGGTADARKPESGQTLIVSFPMSPKAPIGTERWAGFKIRGESGKESTFRAQFVLGGQGLAKF